MIDCWNTETFIIHVIIIYIVIFQNSRKYPLEQLQVSFQWSTNTFNEGNYPAWIQRRDPKSNSSCSYLDVSKDIIKDSDDSAGTRPLGSPGGWVCFPCCQWMKNGMAIRSLERFGQVANWAPRSLKPVTWGAVTDVFSQFALIRAILFLPHLRTHTLSRCTHQVHHHSL